jgi:ornithine cyclodeaminase
MSSQEPSTLYLGAPDVARIVSRKGLSACLAGIAACIEQDFRRWSDFDKSARVASHSRHGVIELMPVADDALYAFKYVNGHPRNPGAGLPTVMAFGVLAAVATGAPLLLAELTLATALRTAAMSALAARMLARPGSRTMALIGNGAQAEFQALAFRDRLGIETLRLFDTDPRATTKLMRNLRGQGLVLRPCADAGEAVRGADIVTTATADKARAAILRDDMVAPGMHLNAIGGDCPGKTELDPALLRRAAVFVEYEPQTRIEGELQQMPADFTVTEFWQVLAGRRPGRVDAAQLTVFDSVGFALEDYATLRFLRAAADELGIGQTLQLVPRMTDPKDLYGTLARSADPRPAERAIA